MALCMTLAVIPFVPPVHAIVLARSDVVVRTGETEFAVGSGADLRMMYGRPHEYFVRFAVRNLHRYHGMHGDGRTIEMC